MAAIQTEIEVQAAPRNTRLNEIIAIGMIALALLLGLCLASITQTILRGMQRENRPRTIGLARSERMSRLHSFRQLASLLIYFPFCCWRPRGAASVPAASRLRFRESPGYCCWSCLLRRC